MTPDQPSRAEILASLERVEGAVADLRRLVDQQGADAAAPSAAVPPGPETAPEPAPQPAPAARPATPAAFPPPVATSPPRPSPLPAFPSPQGASRAAARAPGARAPRARRSTEQWIGANALAVIGGGAVLLGIVFFVAIAIRRGLIPPSVRMAGAALTCAGLLWLADVLHRRFPDGPVIPRVLTVIGVLGGYATLLGTVVGFELLPDWTAYPLAAGIAAAGVVMAYRLGEAWPASLAMGLASFAALSCIDHHYGVSAVFALLVLVAAGELSLRLGPAHVWGLSVPGAVLAAAMYADPASAADAPPLAPGLGMLTAVALVTVALAIVHDLQRRPGRLARAALVLLPSMALVVALTGHEAAVDAHRPGLGDAWVLGLGAAYLAVGVGLYLVSRRLIGGLVAAIGFAQIGVALGLILDGPGLTVGWCAQAMVAAWAAARLADRRPLAASAIALVAAAVSALAVSPAPDALVEAAPDVTRGVIALVALAVGLVGTTYLARGWLASDQIAVLYAAGGVVGLFSLSVALTQALGASDQSTQVTLSACWALVGLAGVVLGLRHRVAAVRVGGLCLLYAALAKLALFDLRELDSLSRAASFVLVGALALGGAFAYQRLQTRMRPEASAAAPGERGPTASG